MSQMELPARETIKAFGGLGAEAGLSIRDVARRMGRPWSTVFSRIKANNRFPHWWTGDLMAIAAREGVELPKPKPRKPRKAKRRAA